MDEHLSPHPDGTLCERNAYRSFGGRPRHRCLAHEAVSVIGTRSNNPHWIAPFLRAGECLAVSTPAIRWKVTRQFALGSGARSASIPCPVVRRLGSTLDLPRISLAMKAGIPGMDISTLVNRISHFPAGIGVSAATVTAGSSMDVATRFWIMLKVPSASTTKRS